MTHRGDVLAGSDVRWELVRVLIVDTDVEMLSRLTGYLERHQMKVTPVADGDAMWTALKHQAIDLLILAIHLKGLVRAPYLEGVHAVAVEALKSGSGWNDFPGPLSDE